MCICYDWPKCTTFYLVEQQKWLSSLNGRLQVFIPCSNGWTKGSLVWVPLMPICWGMFLDHLQPTMNVVLNTLSDKDIVKTELLSCESNAKTKMKGWPVLGPSMPNMSGLIIVASNPVNSLKFLKVLLQVPWFKLSDILAHYQLRLRKLITINK